MRKTRSRLPLFANGVKAALASHRIFANRREMIPQVYRPVVLTAQVCERRSSSASPPRKRNNRHPILLGFHGFGWLLPGAARPAIALMFLAGLRSGEARAAKWADYDAEKGILCVSRSIWRTHLSDPKTEQSVAPVPVARTLADILAELPRTSEFILAGPKGRPVDLHNLARRVVVPNLERCAVCREMKSNHKKAGHEFNLDEPLPKWRGWYGRGCATLATSLDSALAAKILLRHSDIQTTAAHYIKSIPAEAVRAMDKIDALFDNANGSGIPN